MSVHSSIRCFNHGWNAQSGGRLRIGNPYTDNPERESWFVGWDAAAADQEKRQARLDHQESQK